MKGAPSFCLRSCLPKRQPHQQSRRHGSGTVACKNTNTGLDIHTKGSRQVKVRVVDDLQARAGTDCAQLQQWRVRQDRTYTVWRTVKRSAMSVEQHADLLQNPRGWRQWSWLSGKPRHRDKVQLRRWVTHLAGRCAGVDGSFRKQCHCPR